MKKMDVHIVGLGNLGSAFLNGLKGLDANIYLYEESNEVRQSIQKNYSISPEESLTAIRGGVLLLWVINNLRQDFFGKNKIKTPQLKSAETKSFSVGVYQVLIADLTLSFDNTIAVVAASKGNFHLMVIGLLLSVFLIATLASYFAEYIKKHMWLGYLGLFVILVISIQLIIGGLVSYEVLSINEKYKFLFL